MCFKKAVITGLFLFLGLGFLFVEGVIAQGKIEKVIVTGMGANEQGAIKNATKAAVQQVVGMYVVSEEVMKKHELIKDEVLTHSNAYVRSFKVLKKSKDEDGLIEISAQVEVEIGKLAGKLQDLNISIKAIETGEFFAVSADKLSSAKSFKEMAQKIIFDPIKENKKIWDIKVLSLKPLDAPPQNVIYNLGWQQGDRSKYKLGELIPIRLDFKISLNNEYLNPVLQLLEKSSKKVYKRHKFWRNNNWHEKFYLIPFFEIGVQNTRTNRRLIKAFELKQRDAEILKELWRVQVSMRYYQPVLEITLLDSNKSELGRLVYKNRGFAFAFRERESSISASTLYYSHGRKLIYHTETYKRSLELGLPGEGAGFAKNNLTFQLFFVLDEEKIEAVKAIKIELYSG